MNQTNFTFRECVMLCLPALVIGLVLRILLTMAVPEGFYGSDSNSYFDTARKLWNEHRFAVNDKRRWLYPIMLAPSPVLPVSPARSIPFAQHLIGLASILGIGWITGH